VIGFVQIAVFLTGQGDLHRRLLSLAALGTAQDNHFRYRQRLVLPACHLSCLWYGDIFGFGSEISPNIRPSASGRPSAFDWRSSPASVLMLFPRHRPAY
jgi:hypothetical protein